MLVVLAICYFKHTTKLFEEFNKIVLPLAKSHLLFIQPETIAGDSGVSDFTTFYASGLLNRERLMQDPNIDVYDPILLTQTIGRLIAPMRPSDIYCIQYAPIFFALTTPSTCFDLYTAWCIWFFASAICIAIVFFMRRHKFLKERPVLLVGLPIYFISMPVTTDFFLGQTTAFEAAIIAISFGLLINKKYFWAGLIAGLAFLKLQQALIILIPGICVGRSKFFYGCLLMIVLEGVMSVFLVGPNNIFNFIKANYLCEITHSYIGLNETWAMSNFRALLYNLPFNVSLANIIAAIAYIFCCVLSVWLWIKIYQLCKKLADKHLS